MYGICRIDNLLYFSLEGFKQSCSGSGSLGAGGTSRAGDSFQPHTIIPMKRAVFIYLTLPRFKLKINGKKETPDDNVKPGHRKLQ